MFWFSTREGRLAIVSHTLKLTSKLRLLLSKCLSHILLSVLLTMCSQFLLETSILRLEWSNPVRDRVIPFPCFTCLLCLVSSQQLFQSFYFLNHFSFLFPNSLLRIFLQLLLVLLTLHLEFGDLKWMLYFPALHSVILSTLSWRSPLLLPK